MGFRSRFSFSATVNFYEASRRQRCLYCDCNLRAAEREIGPKNTIAPAAYDGVYRVPLRTALGGWASRTTACLITPLSPRQTPNRAWRAFRRRRSTSRIGCSMQPVTTMRSSSCRPSMLAFLRTSRTTRVRREANRSLVRCVLTPLVCGQWNREHAPDARRLQRPC